MGLHCYSTLSEQGDSVNTRRLFFLDVGRMPAASQLSIQFHMVRYCSTIKALFIDLYKHVEEMDLLMHIKALFG